MVLETRGITDHENQTAAPPLNYPLIIEYCQARQNRTASAIQPIADEIRYTTKHLQERLAGANKPDSCQIAPARRSYRQINNE
jgi:hypothetical protein